MIEISIITINYNGLADTCALIETIPNNDNLEVIVVDNASNNQEVEADTISKKYPHVKVIKSEKNLGFAGGNNLGIKAAQGKYLFFINNDTLYTTFKDYCQEPIHWFGRRRPGAVRQSPPYALCPWCCYAHQTGGYQ